eukprot:TRINITY_DN9869_c0_g1_i1.p3 TRINITY_DN9869_c0_g1~~TRINITY_DN9869_c0_g1_i1.p3  ORF type:complete len:143 (+),score=8.66 TRINITY_DN9869_c0_g1_i1:439-867(+)
MGPMFRRPLGADTVKPRRSLAAFPLRMAFPAPSLAAAAAFAAAGASTGRGRGPVLPLRLPGDGGGGRGLGLRRGLRRGRSGLLGGRGGHGGRRKRGERGGGGAGDPPQAAVADVGVWAVSSRLPGTLWADCGMRCAVFTADA